MKTCTKCQTKLPAASFYKDRNHSKDRRTPDCSLCRSTAKADFRRKFPQQSRREWNRWRARNRAQARASFRNYYQRNQVDLLKKKKTYDTSLHGQAVRKNWVRSNRAKVRVIHQRYRLRHKARIKARQHLYYLHRTAA